MNEFDKLPDILLPSEVALIFRVNAATVKRWSNKGKLPFHKTIGGHARYSKKEVLKVFYSLNEENK